ncbi:3'-5' RNA helicase YTHDC2 isoform X1 [Synchiropus splendidus]|uniref:3'-5' RNA helicase YTHDC2 isoform X1 n=1 Tax=Synchiropus splendidus TaxID=270530 RepID=UPI00237EA47E|nr:3'-5' RNA helicase YTHDC2 isoform X1 [Synchiropus splendidus]XP_053726375.1 3'-5' RNA helicase YTHDC2 isoform X1 [Synchiropus splendidus]XP_053726384.1 3'-5' RNA helicase YTHDC2 isoform X1 [Synchiropus splendidus]
MSKKGAKGHKKTKPPPPGSFKEIHIDEEVKISVSLSLERFHLSDEKEMQFPSSLTSTERAFIHRLAQSQGYISKSTGKGSSRFLTIKKKSSTYNSQPTYPLRLCHNSLTLIRNLLQRYPASNKEDSRSVVPDHDNSTDKSKTNGRLIYSIPLVPQRRSPSEFDTFRSSLPVHERQEEITQLIRENRVVLVLGETGSGKTTQIPQFILDDCCWRGVPSRIICTQPRRLAAIAVAERVAAERGEIVGHTVGYHIRLKSRVSPKTLLTFCTCGVFLRTLMLGDASLRDVTHVIVDEVHERDGLADFLLTKMREVLQKSPTIKLILSSAALDVDLFLNYFGSCPIIHLKGRQFVVNEFFLEDILRLTDFGNRDKMKYKEETEKEEQKRKVLTDWCKAVVTSVDEEQSAQVSSLDLLGDSNDLTTGDNPSNSQGMNAAGQQLVPWLYREMDTCISLIFLKEDLEAFTQLFNLIHYENVDVDYTHSETGATALMVTAGRGLVSQVEQLLSMGADVHKKSSNGWTAIDFATHFQQTEALDLLQSQILLGEAASVEEPVVVQCDSVELSAEDQETLKQYHHSFDDELVDVDLIIELLYYICSTSSEGAVLIFLPGYNEIVTLKDRILYDDKRFCTNCEKYQVFTLHSDMHAMDQKRAMKPSPPGVRKLILSTNIAETSITINDVVFVIDSGKVKEKSFDTISHVSMLKSVWISKASALQRKGRAGRCRPGVCFRLYSRLRFNSMLEFQVPQLQRMALQELCLQTKMLAPSLCSIADFLSKAPQPPPVHTIKTAIQMLKTIDALDQNEDLTHLGYHLADLPVEPHLGKMVLCGVVLKCLDPILTIACTLGYRDPFVLPAQASHKRAALLRRLSFTANTYSDHMALLRIFQAWQKACADGCERTFCEKNFLSQATMDMILGMRTHLLGQLRAIGFVRAHGGCDIRDVNMNSDNWAVVKAALVAGMYPNLVYMNKEGSRPSTNKEKKVLFHPTSILSHYQLKKSTSGKLDPQLPTDWLIYDEMSRINRVASVRCCSLVTPITIAIFGGCARTFAPALQDSASQKEAPLNDSDSEAEEVAELRIDDWLVFHMDKEAAELVSELKRRWHSLFLKRIRYPSKPWSLQDEAFIHTVVNVLSVQEELDGLLQPVGIGQRPRPMAAEDDQIKMRNPRSKFPSTPDTSQYKVASATKVPQKRYSNTSGSPSCNQGASFSGKQHLRSYSPQLSFSTTRYFIMKSSNAGNIEVSQQKGIWSTTPNNETKLVKAFQKNHPVILFFSVQSSGHFQGYARMTSTVTWDSCHDWGFTGLGGVFKVEWIKKEHVSFHCTKHIQNQWNDNKNVQMSRDGQELDTNAGRKLMFVWDDMGSNQ